MRDDVKRLVAEVFCAGDFAEVLYITARFNELTPALTEREREEAIEAFCDALDERGCRRGK